MVRGFYGCGVVAGVVSHSGLPESIHMRIVILRFKLLLFITQFIASVEFGKSINEIVVMTSTIECLVQLRANKGKKVKFLEYENCLHRSVPMWLCLSIKFLMGIFAVVPQEEV